MPKLAVIKEAPQMYSGQSAPNRATIDIDDLAGDEGCLLRDLVGPIGSINSHAVLGGLHRHYLLV